MLADRKLDSSIVYFKKALPIYEKAQAWERVARCYNRISENKWRNRESEASLQNAYEAIKIHKQYIISPNREEAYAYDNIGNYYENISDYDKALTYYQKAFRIQKEIFPEIHPDIAKTYQNLGLIKQYVFEFENALQYHKKALKINEKAFSYEHKDVAWNYNNIGVVYRLLGKYEKALECQKKSAAIRIKIYGENHASLAYNYINIGSIYSQLIQNEKALLYYQKAALICIANGDDLRLALAYANIGTSHFAAGNYNLALKFYKKSLDLQLKVYKGKKHPVIAKTFMSMGNTLEKNNKLKESLDCYKSALSIYRTTLGENHSRVGVVYMNIANFYTRNKEYNKALDHYTKSLHIGNTSFEKNESNIGFLYFSMSNFYKEKKEYKEALFYAQKSLKITKNYNGEQHFLTLESYLNIAYIFNLQKKHQDALIYCNKALIANIRDSNQNTFDINNYYDHKLLLEALSIKAKAFQSLFMANKEFSDLNESIKIYKKAGIIIKNLRKSHQGYKDKVSFAKQTKDIYQEAIRSLMFLYRKTKKEESLLNIFSYSEKSKSNTLRYLLNDSNAKSFSGISTDVIELEKDLRIGKAFYQSKVNEEVSDQKIDSSKLSQYESKFFEISRRQDSLTKVLEKKYPKYYELKYKNEVISVTEIQKQLDEKTTLLEFFTADNITYAFTISKNKIAVKELSTPKIDEHIEQFRASITKNYEEYQEISYQLYQTLVTPIKKELVGNQLIIVPDGPLWHLNFDLLLTKEDASNNPKNWSYLLKDYAISYANSATLLFGNEGQQVDSKKDQECLAFSFSSGDTISTTRNVSLETFRNSSMDLPGTREEIKAIANIVDGQYFYGSEATEDNFKKHARDYNILHLALHGDVDNERPENSRLYFTKSKDTVEDNYLYSHELFALDIPAELTVLSACNTGTGKIAKGEGIMSLGNAFQYAGTKSLLLTNWEVSDETTPKIMEYFYTNLKEGKNKAEALQQAKLQFLATTNEETYHPYYWGGFYLLGDTTVIQFKDNNHIYWWVGIGILALILLSLFWYRRNLNHAGFK